MRVFQQTERTSGAESILRRLEWTVIRRLDGLLHGDYQTLFRGFGLDLADLREYQYHVYVPSDRQTVPVPAERSIRRSDIPAQLRSLY